MNNSEAFFYPPKMGKVILLGLEEVIGKSGIEAVFRLTGKTELNQVNQKISFETISLLHQTLEQAYGPRGGRGRSRAATSAGRRPRAA